jgi:hypothetical protein
MGLLPWVRSTMLKCQKVERFTPMKVRNATEIQQFGRELVSVAGVVQSNRASKSHESDQPIASGLFAGGLCYLGLVRHQ